MRHMLTLTRCCAPGARLALLATFLATLALPASAQETLVRAQMSEDAAVAMVRDQTEGKVVRVDRSTEGGTMVYRIRVLSPDGRLREFRVDAATGSLR